MESVSRGSGVLDCKGKRGSQREESGGESQFWFWEPSVPQPWNLCFDPLLELLGSTTGRAVGISVLDQNGGWGFRMDGCTVEGGRGWVMDGGGGYLKARKLVQKAFTTAQKTNDWGLKLVWRL